VKLHSCHRDLIADAHQVGRAFEMLSKTRAQIIDPHVDRTHFRKARQHLGEGAVAHIPERVRLDNDAPRQVDYGGYDPSVKDVLLEIADKVGLLVDAESPHFSLVRSPNMHPEAVLFEGHPLLVDFLEHLKEIWC
jgi:hypothetical protein